MKSTCKKAKSSTGHEIHCNTPKANYRNPPALDGVCLRMALLRCHVQSSTLHSRDRFLKKSLWERWAWVSKAQGSRYGGGEGFCPSPEKFFDFGS